MDILFSILILVISFYGLHRVTDGYFVPSLDEITRRLNITADVAGATFMAVGSSAPELFISLLSLVKGAHLSDMGAGTIVGSAIFNLLVIVGASALVHTAVLTWQPMVRDLLFYSFSILLLFWVLRDGLVEFDESLYFVGFYGAYLLFLPAWRRIFPYREQSPQPMGGGAFTRRKSGFALFNSLLSTSALPLRPIDLFLRVIMPDLKKNPQKFMTAFFLSVAFITGLSWLLVESGVILAQALGMSYFMIGVTVLAIGSSIPDLLSSVIVARQGKGDMAVSNAIGSNIFDILVGLGLVWLLMTALRGEPIAISREKLDNSILLLGGSVVVLFGVMIFRRWRIGFSFGVMLILLYLLYLGATLMGLL